MANVNMAILIGRVATDPELRSTKTGDGVLNFRMATNKAWKDKSGQQKEKTEYHSIVVWGNGANGLSKFLKKGMSVYVEGEINTREHEKDGVKKYYTEIKANVTQVLSDKRGEQDVHHNFVQDSTARRLGLESDGSDLPF